jgi:hypothetical protein
MKRIVLEWGLIFSVGAGVTLVAVWASSRFVDRSSYHLRIATSSSVQDDLHIILADGALTLCDQFGVDASGNVVPVIVNTRTRTRADILLGNRGGQFTIPGLDVRYFRFARDGYVIWSTRLTLLFPALLFLLLAVFLRRRLQRQRNEAKPMSSK